ncbi:MAG: GEVED domain-containing protein [Caldilineaceae bacterium]
MRAAFATLNGKLYLNVWFDGNRDGDWQDTGECIFDNQRKAQSFEWIVQNWTIDPNTIPAGGFIDIKVPTRLVYNAKPDAAAWMRFTLSEQPAVQPTTGLPDGRGPQQPATFRTGETEDYLRPGKPQGEPGQISIDKTAQTSTSPVNVGDIIEYSVYLNHGGGTAPASTSMVDQLPAEVVLASPPVVTELTPSAAPLVASFNPGSGPNGAVEWSGSLSPGAAIRIDFKVRVRYCPPNGVIQNIAVAHQVDGSEIKATADVKVECAITTPGVELQKHIIIRDGQTISEVVSSPIVGNNVLGYVLRLSSTDGVSHTVMVSDTLPAGIMAVSVNASSGVASIVANGQAVQWNGDVGPANSPVEIRIRIKLTAKIECDQRLINVAKWITRQHSGLSNEVVLWLACSDLGDAPDSTNHAGAAMLAYPATGARYPTVFNVAAPERGPKHLLPRPFHLGKGVTAEAEADLGFDQDGVNNIRPAANTPNLDKRDDGLLAPSSFAHCQINTMKIRVSISPAAVAFFGQNKGYLNVWVDSNRDGDWADELDCPQVAGTVFKTALEHIVIDHIVDVAALGAGVHDLTVVTTSPVHYPTSINQRAWLRLTLSERPSNKPLSASGPGHSNYGDGRGYDDPFRFGETEDYLLPAPSQQEQADPSVEKHGEIWPDYDPAANQRRWIIGWIINYANAGPAPANNVHVVDTYAPPQTLLAEHSIPLVPHTQSGNTLDYNVGTLAAGGSGIVIIRTTVPWTTTPGTVLTNEAKISSDNDGNNSNNSSTASVSVPILPPLLTSPLAGTTCTETVNVSGQAQVGVTVDLYVDGSLAASLPTDAAGNWSTSLTLPDGGHDIYAVAKMGAMTSAPSPTVHIIVDSSLFWDPISLRFTDSSGQVIIPSGRLDESGWSIFLRPGHTYEVSLHICCGDPNAQVTMEIGDLLLTLTDPDGDHVYTATFTIPAGGRFTGTVRICVTCGLIRRCSDGTVLIDPEGTVFNVVTGQPIDGANVACLQETAGDGTSTFELWPASSFGQVNAQTVGADGYYSFFTPSGTYQVEVTKEGYQSHRSPNLVVTDTPVHYDVPLTPNVSENANQLIAITDGGFEPAVVTVEPGSVIEWVNAGEAAHSTVSAPNVVQAAQGGESWDSGLLNTGESYKRTLTTEGTYSYQDATDPSITGTIIVKKASVTPPEPTAKEIFLPLVQKQ